MCSAMDYHHSFRAFRAQSLNLINVAVHILRLSESLQLRFSGHVLDVPKMWSGGN